jgi:hypothetical protein
VSDDTLIRCETVTLSEVTATYQDLVDESVKDLLQRIKRWARRNGYWLAGSSTHIIRHGASFGVVLTVEGYLRPRTDGEWPSIHLAVREDQEALRGLLAPRRSRPSIPAAWRLLGPSGDRDRW